MHRRLLPLVALSVPFVAEAAAPARIPVTGYLTDANGAPIDGDVTLDVSLYAAPTGGSPLWTETEQAVLVDQGQFTVYLGDGSGDPLGLDLFRDHGTLYLGIAVNTAAEMTPRFGVATAPFAGYAQYCDDAATVAGMDPTTFRTTATKIDWSDLDATSIPSGLSDGDNDTLYTAGTGLTLSSGNQFAADRATIESWATGVAYDTVTELRTQLDSVYAAKQTCAAKQVLAADGSGAWVCTDATALPISETAVDNAVANNGYAAASDLTSLQGRVGTAETNITNLQGSVFDLTANHTLSGNNNFTGTLRVPTGASLPATAAAGAMFFNTTDKQLYTSTGSAWVRLVQAPGAGGYPASCKALKASNPETPDGIQWIDPDGAGGVAPYPAWCDMTTDGGGWTLIWTKVTPSFVNWKATPDYSCGRSVANDCASAVPPALTWTRAMWRFADSANIVIEYDNTAAPEFTSYLNGTSVSNNPTVGGLTKVVGGVATGPSSVAQIHYWTGNGISEQHAFTDQWIDLWNGADGTNNYTYTETAASWGTKCLGGWCRYNTPVLMLVR